MNWDQIQGKWMEYKGKVKQRWGKLTDSDLTVTVTMGSEEVTVDGHLD